MIAVCVFVINLSSVFNLFLSAMILELNLRVPNLSETYLGGFKEIHILADWI